MEIVSTSGGILRLLREKGRFLDYLAVIGSFPYRVTMLHVTADYLCASVPAVVAAVKMAALSGSLSLTRKSLQPSHCSYLGGIDVDGHETGTVYLGKRENADVWAKVYDKRHERLSRGFADPGSLLRVEVALQSDVGVTLRDVHQPADVFFQYAGKSLVAVPDGFAGWQSHAEGFVLPPRPSALLMSASIPSSLTARACGVLLRWPSRSTARMSPAGARARHSCAHWRGGCSLS